MNESEVLPGPDQEAAPGEPGEPGEPDAGRPAPRTWVPAAVVGAASWCGRLLLIGAVLYFTVRMAASLSLVVLALFAGLLLTALLRPAADWLRRHGVPALASTWVVLLTALVLTAATLYYVVQRAVAQLGTIRQSVGTGLERVRDMLVETFGLSREGVTAATQRVIDQVTAGSGGDSVSIPVMQGTNILVAVLAAVGLALFTAFWFVYDGERAWRSVVRLVPEQHRVAVHGAGQQAWKSLGGYLRGVTIVALIDAVGIGVALLLLGVPMPLALALLTFIGGYVPLVGATIAGMAAVLVALASEGVTTALLTLGAVLLVQQIEGQLLAPLIMGRSVELHPLLVAYAITIGGLLYGLAGAVVAVPVTAVVHAVGAHLAGRADRAEPSRRPRLRRGAPAGPSDRRHTAMTKAAGT